jgi:hypothetical protein
MSAFPPKSGHVRCKTRCLLWANSGYSALSGVSAYSRRDNHKTDEIRADDFASPDQKIQDEQPGKEASKNREEAMVRLSALASLLLSLVVLSSATCVPLAKEVEVNGVRLQYLEQGSGEPVVFVHGAISDLRTWPPAVSETVAKKYRFIAYTQRYHGTGPWNDDGRKYSVATHADDLAKFISALNVGPAHVVGWSYGGWVAIIAAQNTPSLVRSLILYEGGPPLGARARQRGGQDGGRRPRQIHRSGDGGAQGR